MTAEKYTERWLRAYAEDPAAFELEPFPSKTIIDVLNRLAREREAKQQAWNDYNASVEEVARLAEYAASETDRADEAEERVRELQEERAEDKRLLREALGWLASPALFPKPSEEFLSAISEALVGLPE